jgi:hypothetical protein
MGQVCAPLSVSPRPPNGLASDSLVRRAGPQATSEKLTGGPYKSVASGAGSALREFASITVARRTDHQIPCTGGILPFLPASDTTAKPLAIGPSAISRTGRRLSV